ncbi:MAG: Smr/MutS family protein [Deltaproteobacteria bacterium]|nr:Smr/MutS family protein [Deltaproteobacteria bacterium]
MNESDFQEGLVVVPIEDSLDLHTYRPQDIRDLLEDYLEATYEKGFVEVRIIHGKGSGMLRKRVTKILARHPRVISFRQADTAAGGNWGATIVLLKKQPLGVQAGERSIPSVNPQ